MKIFKFIFVFGILIFCGLVVSCKNETTPKESYEVRKTKIETLEIDENRKIVESKIADSIPNIEISVIVIPCSNGYEYAIQGYEIESIIENALSISKKVRLEKFPLWKFKGSGYQGVYDKKYCSKILKIVDADFIVMSEINGGFPPMPNETLTWGYETKILNTKTREQRISISAKNLKIFEDVEKDIALKINEMIEVMRKMK